MNPMEYTDTIREMQVNKILKDTKDTYTKEEVIALIQEISYQQKKAIYNGEYIFNVDFINGEKVLIKDEEYSIKKMFVNNDKYIIFIQTENDDVEPLRQSVPNILALSKDILGVFIISSKADVNLITAKLSEKYKEEEYAFVDSDLETISQWTANDSFYTMLNNDIKEKSKLFNSYYTTSFSGGTNTGTTIKYKNKLYDEYTYK